MTRSLSPSRAASLLAGLALAAAVFPSAVAAGPPSHRTEVAQLALRSRHVWGKPPARSALRPMQVGTSPTPVRAQPTATTVPGWNGGPDPRGLQVDAGAFSPASIDPNYCNGVFPNAGADDPNYYPGYIHSVNY